MNLSTTQNSETDRGTDEAAELDRALWLSVIAQALEDAKGNKASVSLAERAQARAWLTGHSADFREVCALAGLEPECVRHQAHKIITEAGDEQRSANTSLIKRSPPRSDKASKPRECSARIVVTFDGRAHTIPEWAEITGLGQQLIRSRLSLGWSPERALTEKPTHRGQPRSIFISAFGKELSLVEWANDTGLSRTAIKARLENGWTTERALTTPADPNRLPRHLRDRGVGRAQTVNAGTGALPTAQISA